MPQNERAVGAGKSVIEKGREGERKMDADGGFVKKETRRR